MESLTTRRKVLEQKPMTFWERLYLPAILQGLSITMSHFFRKKVTVQYPEQQRKLPDVFRGVQELKRDENGAERCTACGLCALACPAEAITMEAGERKPGEEHLYREEKYATKYEINMLRCIFCGFCEEACPKEAIFLEAKMLPSNYSRSNFIFGKDLLLEPLKNEKKISEA